MAKGRSSMEPIAEGRPREDKKRAKVLAHIEIHQAENGGHIVRHHFDNSGPGYGYHEPEEHIFSEGEGDKLVAHVKKHMKVRTGKDEEETEPGEAPAPGE